MKKENVFSLIRTILTALGSFLIGKNIFGNVVDQSILEIIVGAVLSIVSIAWSIADKTANIEMLQSGIRKVFVMIGGLLVASGKLDAAKLDTYLGLALSLIPFLYSLLSKKKSQEIAEGTISVQDLAGVKKPPLS